jgi:hypothetical protein
MTATANAKLTTKLTLVSAPEAGTQMISDEATAHHVCEGGEVKEAGRVPSRRT